MRPLHPILLSANQEVENTYDQLLNELKVMGDQASKEPSLEAFFARQANFFLKVEKERQAILKEDHFSINDFETLLKRNHDLYVDMVEEKYNESYINPTYAVSAFGQDLGQLLSSLAYHFTGQIAYGYEHRKYDMHLNHQLLISLYKAMIHDGKTDGVFLKELVKDHFVTHMEKSFRHEWLRRFSPAFDTYSHIPATYDLHDLRYLFRYGMYVGDNEIKSAKYLLTIPEDQVEKIANTFTEAFVRGFVRNDIPLGHKRTALVTYHLGFERLIRQIYGNLEALNLKPLVFYHTRPVARPRLINTRQNLQMEYDHRFSDGLFVDEAFVEMKLGVYEKVMKEFEEELYLYAGPALMEVFGQAPFSPVNKKEAIAQDKKAADLEARLVRGLNQEYAKYVPGDAYSFTINDYPLPSIGKDYEAIFNDTIAVNTLDEAMYEAIQDKIIDALDQSEYVHIKGAGDNETDLRVALWPIKDPEKETKFDNCTADVNVPVGEVYTSPKLEGTNGLLHVKEIYLTSHRYENLKIWFKDGMIQKYDCTNFETEEENRNFVKETLISPHETLPLGEFAIGTNTVAYMMAMKYQIHAVLPILIGEKTGPHFAIGDTCFTWSEDSPTYNSNGKEVIARENEKTKLRKTDPEKAYTYRHTDITIPYHELDTIIGYGTDGNPYKIIEGGRFVLAGTEALNDPFDH